MPIRKRHISRAKRRNSGFTLLEVMLSLFFLAVGLLGMTALQHEALRYNHAAFTDSQAQFLITDMMERIRANQGGGVYAIGFTEPAASPTVNCTATNCNSTQMAIWDIKEWRDKVENTDYLPDGESAINFNPLSNVYTISIRYEWSQLGGVDLTEGKRTVSVTTRI